MKFLQKRRGLIINTCLKVLKYFLHLGQFPGNNRNNFGNRVYLSNFFRFFNIQIKNKRAEPLGPNLFGYLTAHMTGRSPEGRFMASRN